MFDDGDEEAGMAMVSIQEKMEKNEEHVLNFKGSIKGRITVARDRLKGARDLYDDYFKRPNPVFHECRGVVTAYVAIGQL